MTSHSTTEGGSRRRLYRWWVLFAYLGALILTQVFWYNFAPLISVLVTKYGITELTASWTILVFPLASLLASGHAGSLIDRRGYRFAIRAGLALMTVGSALRVFDRHFGLVLAGQAVIALSVPYIVTSIATLVTDWFDRSEEARATGLCTVGIFVGIALSLSVSPVLTSAVGFHVAMVFFAAAAAGWTVLFAATVRQNRAATPALAASRTAWLPLFRNHNLAILFAFAFMAQGSYNAVTTWMEVIWRERGFPSQAAGLAGGMVIVGGIVGCLIFPAAMDRVQKARLTLLVCLIPTIFLIHPFLWADSPRKGYMWGVVLGFFELPCLAITLTVLERSAGKEHAGSASGLYWTMGNAGVLGLTVLLELLKKATSWHMSINAVILITVVLTALAAGLREPKLVLHELESERTMGSNVAPAETE
jgi:MFS transporter, FLVCR family, feline leukemia virus subgroup C receptor-related protein